MSCHIQIIQGQASDRPIKAVATTGDFPRALHKHRFTWHWTWSWALPKEVMCLARKVLGRVSKFHAQSCPFPANWDICTHYLLLCQWTSLWILNLEIYWSSQMDKQHVENYNENENFWKMELLKNMVSFSFFLYLQCKNLI